MSLRFDANKSTKGASKLRRDLINAEIANLRDLLPLPPSTRQRLSQLQLMALVCVYVRKTNYFQQAFKCHSTTPQASTPSIGFSKALNGFLMMMTQNGKLLYISDNAAEYLGHSMEDLLIHGDSVYDIIDKQDHQVIQAEMARSPTSPEDEYRMFMCRINVTRNARRQMRFGDQKVVLVQGRYLSFLPLCSRNEPVFIATCTPIAMPETRECVVQGATNVFTSIHSMDMKFMYLDRIGEHHLGYLWVELQGVSWYRLLHWECMQEAQAKHRLITQSEQDRACILLVRLQRRLGDWIWVHCVLQVKDNIDNNQHPVIVCTNQILSEREATVMRANSWLYEYYMVQSKLQYGINYGNQNASRPSGYYHSYNAATPTLPNQMQVLDNQIPASQDTKPSSEMQTLEKVEPVDYSVQTAHQNHYICQINNDYDERHPNGDKNALYNREKQSNNVDTKADLNLDLNDERYNRRSVLMSTRQQMYLKSSPMVVDHNESEQWNTSPTVMAHKVTDEGYYQDFSPYYSVSPSSSTASQGKHSQSQFTFDVTQDGHRNYNDPRISTNTLYNDECYQCLSVLPWALDQRIFPPQPLSMTRISESPTSVSTDFDNSRQSVATDINETVNSPVEEITKKKEEYKK